MLNVPLHYKEIDYCSSSTAFEEHLHETTSVWVFMFRHRTPSFEDSHSIKVAMDLL